MKPRQFFDRVAFMREKQKEYYRTRDKEVLKQSIALEQEIDAEIARVRAILAVQEAMEAKPAEKPPDPMGGGFPKPPAPSPSLLPDAASAAVKDPHPGRLKLNPEPDCRYFRSPDRCRRRARAHAGRFYVIPPCHLSYGPNPTCPQYTPQDLNT